MLLVYLDENAMNETERAECYLQSAELAQQIHAKGQYLGAAPLHPVSTATSVRIRDGKWFLTDGPFAETREQLGGFFMIDAKNLDGAIRIAAEIPAARYGTVEIRPVMEVPGLPEQHSIVRKESQ
jgi:hypothetical protein